MFLNIEREGVTAEVLNVERRALSSIQGLK